MVNSFKDGEIVVTGLGNIAIVRDEIVVNYNIWNPETKSVERLEIDDCFNERGINMERSEEMWDAVEKEHGPLSMREAFVTLSAMQWADKTMIEKLEKWLEHIAEYTGHDLETIKESFNTFIDGND